MSRASARELRFVRALLGGAEAVLDAGTFRAEVSGRTATLEAPAVAALCGSGVLESGAGTCRAAPGARSWVRRQLCEGDDGFASQHRQEVRAADGRLIDLSESPLARLAVAGPGETSPFLAAHQVEAGERVRRLVERAQLRQRVTMSYSPATVGGRARPASAAEISDLAADARRALAELHRVLPRDCAAVVLDVCGLLKGLQTIETERGWPRRSAKLVLRIGLDQLATHYGLSSVATGGPSRRDRTWMAEGARPDRFE